MTKIHILITKEETKLVKKIASNIYSKYFPMGGHGTVLKDELYHWGIVGLCEAKQRFDESRGIPFPAFAARRVEGEMLDNIRKLPMVRLPQEKQNRVKELRAAKDELLNNGKSVNPEALALILRWPLEEVHQVINLSPSINFLDHPATDEDDDRVPGDIISDDSLNPEELNIKKQIAENVNRCLEALDVNPDRIVIQGRFNLEQTLKELADELDCSIQQVSNIQRRAEGLMRDCLKRQGLGDY